jgi:hypothetical protein
MGTRFIKLLKILIKIGIMMLIMTGLILVNKYISNANGSEKEGRSTSLERMVNRGSLYAIKRGIEPLYTSKRPADMYHLSERTGRT